MPVYKHKVKPTSVSHSNLRHLLYRAPYLPCAVSAGPDFYEPRHWILFISRTFKNLKLIFVKLSRYLEGLLLIDFTPFRL